MRHRESDGKTRHGTHWALTSTAGVLLATLGCVDRSGPTEPELAAGRHSVIQHSPPEVIRFEGDTDPTASVPPWQCSDISRAVVADPLAVDGLAYEMTTRSGGCGVEGPVLEGMDNARGWTVEVRHLALENDGGTLARFEPNGDSDHLRIHDGRMIVMIDFRPTEVRAWSSPPPPLGFSRCDQVPDHCRVWPVEAGAYVEVTISGRGDFFEVQVDDEPAWTGRIGGELLPRVLAFGNSSSSRRLFSKARWDYVRLDTRGPEALVEVEVRPGSEKAPIHLKSGGRLPVAVMGSPTLDVRSIVPSSLTISGHETTGTGLATTPSGRLTFAIEDVDRDGSADFVGHFDIPEMVRAGDLTAHTTALVLRGSLQSGRAIRGSDAVSIVPRRDR